MDRHSRKGLGLSRIFSAVIAVFLVAGAVVAVSTFFGQKFPAVNVSAGMTTQCPSTSTLTANSTLVIAGTDGYIRFQCGTAPAFSTLADAVGAPTFNLTGTVFKSLYIFKHTTIVGTTCTGGDGFIQLSNGGLVQFPANFPGDWDYCARYTNAPLTSTTAFTITWGA